MPALWLLPLLSSGAWIGTILGLLIPWLVQGRPSLPSFDPNQNIAFISDLGAFNLKPLFIAGSSVTIVFYLLTLFAERSRQHKRSPVRATCTQMILSVVVFIGAGLGGAALILLSIFDNFHFKATHDKLVAVFIGGNLVSAVALVLEYLVIVRRHDLSGADQHMARMSFLLKLGYLVLQVAATVAFVLEERMQGDINIAAVLEYVNGGLFAFFILSFVVDLRRGEEGRYSTMLEEKGYGFEARLPLVGADGAEV